MVSAICRYIFQQNKYVIPIQPTIRNINNHARCFTFNYEKSHSLTINRTPHPTFPQNRAFRRNHQLSRVIDTSNALLRFTARTRSGLCNIVTHPPLHLSSFYTIKRFVRFSNTYFHNTDENHLPIPLLYNSPQDLAHTNIYNEMTQNPT